VHAPKNARIQATLHQAAGITRNALRGRIQGANRKLADILGDSKQPVAKRTVNQPTHVVNVSKNRSSPTSLWKVKVTMGDGSLPSSRSRQRAGTSG